MSTIRNIVLAAVPPLLALGCQPPKTKPPAAAGMTGIDGGIAATPSTPPLPPVAPWDRQGPLGPGETYVLEAEGPRRTTVAEARKQGLLDVDLSDEWAPGPRRTRIAARSSDWPTTARAPRRS